MQEASRFRKPFDDDVRGDEAKPHRAESKRNHPYDFPEVHRYSFQGCLPARAGLFPVMIEPIPIPINPRTKLINPLMLAENNSLNKPGSPLPRTWRMVFSATKLRG